RPHPALHSFPTRRSSDLGATPYLRLFSVTLGGCLLASEALAVRDNGNGEAARAIPLARFFAETMTVQAEALAASVTDSADVVNTDRKSTRLNSSHVKISY